jgi:hypothetical protein
MMSLPSTVCLIRFASSRSAAALTVDDLSVNLFMVVVLKGVVSPLFLLYCFESLLNNYD